MNDNIKTIKRLNFENLIWIVFIFISIFDIYGDELLKQSIIYNDKEKEKQAKDIFYYLLIVSLIIYIYFFIRNYNDYKMHQNNDYRIRLLGSALVLIATVCFIYFQIKTKNENDGVSEI